MKRANGSKMIGPAFRDVYDTMKIEFPNIHRYIKKRSGTDISDDLNYQETNTMLRKFAKLVKANYPDLFYVNIHDAVLYKTSDRPKIEKILGDLFKSNKPKFKVEDLKSEFNKMMEAKRTPRRSKKVKEKMIETLNIKLNKDNEIISFKSTWMKKIVGTKKELHRDVMFLKSLTPNPKRPASSLRLNITKAELNNLQPKIQRNQVQILIDRAA
ncbi:hypothetical protein EHS15_11845 [Leptospira idonii]|uniref:Uncharacterized protein n=1 Tax=Leptospira idonii TaxID=1193500 RepID=A0A4R9LX07_9LEPT|nr:hypothetical protein EHS15_11845 [Leptospira idonii]